MAKLANTFTTYATVGNREELSDVISRITPEDTPIYSMIGKDTAKSTHPEWETEGLDPPGENFHAEGDEFDFDAIDTPRRVGNYTQIFRKSWVVSRTQEAVDNAGNAEKIKAEKLRKGIEVRKDIEFALLDNKGAKATDPRKLGSLSSWYETNVSRGEGGANGGFAKTTGLTQAATAGKKRAFTKALLDDAMQQIYQSGGRAKFAVVSPYVKSVFVSFMSDANVNLWRTAATGARNTITATADIYEGPFGKVSILPNRVASSSADMASNIHLLDPSLLSVKMLRPIQNVKNLAKTGDAEKGVIIGEGTLCVKNEEGLGVIADIFGLSAAA
ncbi:MAG: DUF5309 domain-containing protein [Hyphomicrobiales bacterium]